jgi:hypothetical protein
MALPRATREQGARLRETDEMTINKTAVVMGLAGAAVLALAGCNRNGAAVSSQDLGDKWPFSVSEVRVVCAPTMAMFLTADGKAYALNGQAERHPELYKKSKLNPLNDIWKVDPQLSKLSPDVRMSLDAFNTKAIESCEKAGKWDPSKA